MTGTRPEAGRPPVDAKTNKQETNAKKRTGGDERPALCVRAAGEAIVGGLRGGAESLRRRIATGGSERDERPIARGGIGTRSDHQVRADGLILCEPQPTGGAAPLPSLAVGQTEAGTSLNGTPAPLAAPDSADNELLAEGTALVSPRLTSEEIVAS